MVDSAQKGHALPSDHETDLWVAAFICGLHDFFGTPVTGGACKNKADKLQYIWARIGIANALAIEEPMWRAMKDRVDPDLAAEEFARRYFSIRRKMVVDDVPNFSPRGMPQKALPHTPPQSGSIL